MYVYMNECMYVCIYVCMNIDDLTLSYKTLSLFMYLESGTVVASSGELWDLNRWDISIAIDYAYICIYVCMYVCHVKLCTFAYKRSWVYVFKFMYVCMYVSEYVLFVCIYVCMHASIYECMNVLRTNNTCFIRVCFSQAFGGRLSAVAAQVRWCGVQDGLLALFCPHSRSSHRGISTTITTTTTTITTSTTTTTTSTYKRAQYIHTHHYSLNCKYELRMSYIHTCYFFYTYTHIHLNIGNLRILPHHRTALAIRLGNLFIGICMYVCICVYLCMKVTITIYYRLLLRFVHGSPHRFRGRLEKGFS